MLRKGLDEADLLTTDETEKGLQVSDYCIVTPIVAHLFDIPEDKTEIPNVFVITVREGPLYACSTEQIADIVWEDAKKNVDRMAVIKEMKIDDPAIMPLIAAKAERDFHDDLARIPHNPCPAIPMPVS